MKSGLQDNDIEMYLTHNEGKSVIAEIFVKTLKNKIFKYMTSVSKNLYFDKLDDIVTEFNNTYHRTIKIKPINVRSSTSIDFDVENNDKNPKCKVGGNVRISKYKKHFCENLNSKLQ